MRAGLILVLFLIFVVQMIRKRVNTLVGLPVLALLIAAVAGVPPQGILTEVISEGATRLHQPILVILFGATLAELVKRSGIVEVLIKNTAEFLGDRTFLISVFLLLVITVLFSVLAGLGAIVMVGSIVFPILVSLGVSRLLAGCIFLMGLSLGGMLNLFNWSLYTDVLKLTQPDILGYTLRYFPLVLGLSIAFIWLELRREGGSSFKKLEIPPALARAEVPVLAFLTPLVPVALIFTSAALRFEFPILGALFIGIVYGTLTLPKSLGDRTRVLTRSMFEGIQSVGPAVALMVGIGMLLKSVAHPTVKELLNPWVALLVPASASGYLLTFVLAAPLALYRGPLNIWGMGSGLVVMMRDTGLMPAPAIMGALIAVGQIQGISDPTNTYNVWIANHLGVDVIRILKRTLPYAWLMAFLGLVLAAALYY